MHSKVIAFDDERLTGEWHYAQSRERPIVVCHGFNDSRENPTIVALAKGLNEQGYNTFTFNFLKNTGGFDIKHQVEDIRRMVDYF